MTLASDLKKHLDAMIERARIGEGDSDRHLLTLFAVGVGSRGKVFVELGVRDGTSTLPLLLAAKLNGGMLHSVDIQDSTFECPPELRDHWKFTKSDALEFLRGWDSAKKMDLVLVDDWHTYPHVRAELELLEKCITPSTVVLLHDLMYGTDPNYHTNPGMHEGEWAHGGPYRAVAELSKSKFEWATLPWNNGMTLLRRKGRVVKESRARLMGGRLLRKYAPEYLEPLKAWVDSALKKPGT